MNRMTKRITFLCSLPVLVLSVAAFGAVATDTEADGAPLAQPVVTASEHLAGLSADERANARIQLELPAGTDAAGWDRARLAESEWSAGRYDSAIAWIRDLEDRGVVVDVATNWVVPIAHDGPTLGSNVQIAPSVGGEPGLDTAVDRDAQNGNLFAVVRAAGTYRIYRSTNDGVSWAETASWCCNPTQTDGAVVENFFYIHYADGTAVRARRASVTTGAFDGTYGTGGFVDIFTAPAAVEEVVIVTNADDFDNRLYTFTLLANGTITYYWAATPAATTFNSASPSVLDADQGLSAAWHSNADGNEYLLFLSYRSTADTVRFLRRSSAGWAGSQTLTTDVTNRITSISAYDSTVIVGYERVDGSGAGCEYRISYNAGASWSVGTLVSGTEGTAFFVPRVSARSGTGTAGIFQEEAGALDAIDLRERYNYSPGAWGDFGPVNDNDFLTGNLGGDLNWMMHGWGVTYLDNAGAPWFTWSQSIRYSGFESGDFSEWSSMVP